MVLAAFAAVSVLAAGCSLILDFAPAGDGGSSDDAGASDGSAPAGCAEGEPNDTADAPVALDGSIDAAVCGDGPDYWSFEVDGTEDVVAELTFTAGESDLEMQLVSSPDGEVLTISTGTDADERIEQSAALGNRLAAGTYAIAVLGRPDTAQNAYHLAVSLVATPDAGL
jgi:hypothetical protein